MLKHSAKVKRARRFQLHEPSSSLFHTNGWLLRRAYIAERVRRKNIRIKYYIELKKGVR